MTNKWDISKADKETVNRQEQVSQINGTSSNSNNPLWSGMKSKTNFTRTENNALTHKSTQSDILDLFSMGGALRKRSSEDIQKMISKALVEDFKLGVKCLFYLRDVRGGQGERRTFREGLKVLGSYYSKDLEKLLPLIPEYGRWDDILHVTSVDIIKLFREQMFNDAGNVNPSLLFKWLPSENTSSIKTRKIARALRKYLGLSSKKYRKVLTMGRKQLNLIETQMSNKKWKEIDYSKIPSKSNLKYKKAFRKHDEERYDKFLESVDKGEAKINTSTLYPYEIVRKARNENDKTLDTLWNNLPNYVKEDDKGIVVADVSGSMDGDPINVSISLAMYFAERNVGPFKNKFITFSESPELQEVKGNNLNQKITNLNNAHWDMNTNIQAVFDLILNTSIQNKVPQKELPSTIYIISDMEFDEASGRYYGNDDKTNYQVIREKYTNAGYEMPQLVFWNVDSRQNNTPVEQNEEGVILVSGCSPSIFKMVMDKTTPIKFMKTVLNSERYNKIDEVLKK